MGVGMSGPIRTLGVDPGRTGAAVLLAPDGRTALEAWAWKPSRSKAGGLNVRGVSCGVAVATVRRDRPYGLGQWIVEQLQPVPYVLVLEGLFVPRGRAAVSLASFLTLAEDTGELRGPLVQLAEAEHRPKASEWRAAVLGLPRNVSSDRAEEAAIAAIAGGHWGEGLGCLAEDPHVAEAAAMARWGWMQQRAAGARRAG